jgi:hypothetical protein
MCVADVSPGVCLSTATLRFRAGDLPSDEKSELRELQGARRAVRRGALALGAESLAKRDRLKLDSFIDPRSRVTGRQAQDLIPKSLHLAARVISRWKLWHRRRGEPKVREDLRRFRHDQLGERLADAGTER